MTRPDLSVYWWSRPNMVNLGDEMNGPVAEYASGRKVTRAETAESADLLAIGSVLTFPQKDLHKRKNPFLVWGSGSLNNAERTRQELFHVTALRGPLTASILRQRQDVPFGDPGLLASAIWKAPAARKYRWGLVPHFKQLKKPWVQKIMAETPNIVMIDVRDPDIGKSIETLASCDFIASTSLHGLVIADSYGIPNVWLYEGSFGGVWKYFDYFTGIGRRTADPVAPDTLGNLTELEESFGSLAYMSTVDVHMKKVLAAFPL